MSEEYADFSGLLDNEYEEIKKQLNGNPDAFGFDSDPAQEPQVPVSQPLPQETEPSAEAKKELLEVIGKNSDLFPESEIKLDGRQKLQIQLASKHLWITGQRITAQAIYDLWPKGLLSTGRVDSSIKEPEERGKVFRAGFRPPIAEIQVFLGTEEFASAMDKLGVAIDPDENGLTTEQMGLLTILSNPADGRDLKRKLSVSGISWAKYQAWLKQPVFHKAHDEILAQTLKEMMPIAKQQIAAKIAAGDAAMIKFGMEVTGEHDPNGKKQVDARAFLAIVLEVIEEEVKDSEILQRIGAKISIRGSKAIEP